MSFVQDIGLRVSTAAFYAEPFGSLVRGAVGELAR